MGSFWTSVAGAGPPWSPPALPLLALPSTLMVPFIPRRCGRDRAQEGEPVGRHVHDGRGRLAGLRDDLGAVRNVMSWMMVPVLASFTSYCRLGHGHLGGVKPRSTEVISSAPSTSSDAGPGSVDAAGAWDEAAAPVAPDAPDVLAAPFVEVPAVDSGAQVQPGRAALLQAAVTRESSAIAATSRRARSMADRPFASRPRSFPVGAFSPRRAASLGRRITGFD